MSSHNPAAPGFSQFRDPFAGLSRPADDSDALDFEETYDGLGDQLDETDDAFNDDTFGGDGSGISSAPVGKDFDFFGSTAKVAQAIEEEQARFQRQQPAPRAAATTSVQMPNYDSYDSYPPPPKALRSGYEKYREPEPAADLEIDASIWGTAPKNTMNAASTSQVPQPQAQPQTQPPPASGRKIMSLEEVEAALRAQAKPATQPLAQPVHTQPPVQVQHQQHQAVFTTPPQVGHQTPPVDYRYHPVDNHMQGFPSHDGRDAAQVQGSGPHGHPISILQRPSSKHAPSPLSQQHPQPPMMAPTQILQNPNRENGRSGMATHGSHAGYRPQQNSFTRQQQAQVQAQAQAQGVPLPAQMAGLSEHEKSQFLESEAKRAKRHFKIHVFSRDNGLMTPHDKSFITRIQLQQLVSATGDPNEFGTNAALAEDFYYQVYSSLRAASRPHPSQPLNNFAQTYLFQTGNRQGGMRRHGRGPENHMQRMEQQVQRAVEAAKNKPKNQQLVIEGSLGKISFSNAKTPKPLLNIKRGDNTNEVNRPGSAHRPPTTAGSTDRKITLRAIEDVYKTLMKMEDHERSVPVPTNGNADEEFAQRQAEWQSIADKLNQELWAELKIHASIDRSDIHPFIACLSIPKGKKAIPRVFRQLSHEQRTTILTLIVVHLDQLDVIQGAQVQSGEPINLPAAMRESIDTFSLAVMPALFTLLNDTDLHVVTGILGIISSKVNIDTIARTRIGISVLTMVLSRAELIKETGLANEKSWEQWVGQFNEFFNHLEPSLPNIFPGTVTSGEDIYVWQFLAAIGIGASPDEQQRLVLAVKDRVLDTVNMAKTLPPGMAKERLDNVNLFMRSIGLDVELLK